MWPYYFSQVFSSHGGEINSKFKLWIILPVNKVADLEMNGVECSVAVMEVKPTLLVFGSSALDGVCLVL